MIQINTTDGCFGFLCNTTQQDRNGMTKENPFLGMSRKLIKSVTTNTKALTFKARELKMLY